MAKQVRIQVDSEGILSNESDKYVSENGGVINPKFLEFLKKKVADEYRSNPRAYKIASKKISSVKSANLVDESVLYNACFRFEDKMVDFNRRLFSGLKIATDGSDTIVPIVGLDKINMFLETGTHELNHAASVRKKVIRNRNGKPINHIIQFGIDINGRNRYAMEAVNTMITANQTDIPTLAYLSSVLGIFPLNLIMGKNVLQDLSVISPISIVKTVSHLSQDSDYFGKISLLSAIADYYIDKEKSATDEKTKQEASQSYYEVLNSISGLATRDLILPFISNYPPSILKKDKVIEFVRSNQGAYSIYFQTLMYYQVLTNKCETFDEYKKKVDSDFEAVVSKANGLGYKINPNGLIQIGVAGFNGTTTLSPYITRQVIGLNEFTRMREETKRAYEEYVQRICEESDGSLEFESKPARSDDVRATGKFIPDSNSQKDIYLFDYVASKLGYRLDNFRTYLAKDATTCTVEKKLEQDQSDLEHSYEMFNDEIWKCTGLYEGSIYYSNPELDFEK